MPNHINKEMKTKPQEWKLTDHYFRDIHGSNFVEAICAHGVGHHRGIHGCDGCCDDMPIVLLNKTTKD